MKRLLLYLSFLLFSSSAVIAQKIQFGVRGNLGFASQSIDNPDILSKNSVSNLNINAYVEFPLKYTFYLQAGAGITGKGVKEYQNAQTNTITLTYLDIPITLLRKFDLTTLGKIYVGLGPYVAVGLSGNNQSENTNTTSGSAIAFGNSADYKNLDYGANVVTGLELNNHLTFNIKYSLGLNNIASTDPFDMNTTSVKNRIFSVGIGFWL
jgi:hypothetical protein